MVSRGQEMQATMVGRKTGMTVQEAGKKGGEVVKSRYGAKFYVEIGRKGGQSLRRFDEAGR